MDSSTTQWISSRYQILDRIGAGGMGVVYRALDRLNGQTVALKQVTTPGEQLEFASSGATLDFRLALAQEFKTLSSLRHPNIIGVLDYGFDAQRQPYYTMELLEGAQSILEAGATLSEGAKVDLLIQALQALAYLHRRSIIHRDVKPENVVVMDGEVRVLDFGLAVARRYMAEEAEVVGTLAYMAPEVLQSAQATEASDLYSMGVIAYELFAGRHPFGVKDVSALVQGTLYEIPDYSALDVDDDVLTVIMRLLLKSPEDRYNSARDAITELAIATGKTLMMETEVIRESYLQAATFVGRERELERLTGALYKIVPGRNESPKDGHPTGSIWLVEGESGVGKSRLLEELRAQALVAGALVLRGQSVEGGGSSYQVWRNALRYLCLQTELSDVEAGVLKLLVPDIETLIGRPVALPPDVDPQAAQERLLNVIQSVFARQTQPVVLLLEDLHWAEEGLQVIKVLGREIDRQALMIVGTYRSDEAPTLADDFLEAELITLERLTEEEIASLSESMLGPVGSQKEVVNFLERETEGNVFFIVEVVRALAEEAGQLEEIGRMTLPEGVFARGMRAIIQHRLNRLPESALLLLQVAAIGGRELDPNVLSQVPSEMDFDDWLFVCEMETVLEIGDNQWRFVHDKLREQLLDDLSDEARAALHEYYAHALEAVYPDEVEMTMTLAYHWEMAGNNEKVGQYTARAGEQAMAISTYDRAVQYLSRAVELTESRSEEARLERLLAEAHYGMGNVDTSLKHTRRALELMDMAAAPEDPFRLNLRLYQQAAVQLAHRLLPGFFLGRGADDSQRLVEASVLHIQAAQSYLLHGNQRAGFLSALYALNLAEKAAPSSELAFSYGAMANTALFLRRHGLSRRYLAQATATLKQVGKDRPQVQAMALHSSVLALIGLGDLEAAKANAETASAVFSEIGDQRRWNESCANLSFIEGCLGNFEQSLFYRFDLLEVSQRRRLARGAAWALAGMIQLSIRLGRLEETQTYLTERSALIRDGDAEMENMTTATYTTLYHYRLGDIDTALKEAVKAGDEIKTLGLRQPHDFYAYFNTIEAVLGLREYADNGGLKVLSQRVIALCGKFARVFPMAQARYLTWQALMKWLDGDQRGAQDLWKQAIQTAHEKSMLYDEGLAHYMMGVHLPESNSSRAEHLEYALEIFKHCGASWDLEKTQQALGR